MVPTLLAHKLDHSSMLLDLILNSSVQPCRVAEALQAPLDSASSGHCIEIFVNVHTRHLGSHITRIRHSFSMSKSNQKQIPSLDTTRTFHYARKPSGKSGPQTCRPSSDAFWVMVSVDWSTRSPSE